MVAARIHATHLYTIPGIGIATRKGVFPGTLSPVIPFQDATGGIMAPLKDKENAFIHGGLLINFVNAPNYTILPPKKVGVFQTVNADSILPAAKLDL